MLKFVVGTISLIFKIYFLEIPWEIVFGVVSSKYFCP